MRAAAVDYGGEFIPSIMKIVERAVVAAKREGVISSTEYHEEGSVAGAAHEALMQVGAKATGLNVGGKIGIARSGNNIVGGVCSSESAFCTSTKWRSPSATGRSKAVIIRFAAFHRVGKAQRAPEILTNFRTAH